MSAATKTKKRLIVSYKNLSEELVEQFKEVYPEGYRDYLQRILKPNGDPIFVVPFETDDCSYMVKFDVKIDSGLSDDDLDKGLFEGDEKDEFDSISEVMDKDEDSNPNHTERTLKHGDYEDVFSIEKTSKSSNEKRSSAGREIEAAFDADEEDEPDDDLDDDTDNDDADEELEPSAEDLVNIDAELLGGGLLDSEPLQSDTKPSQKSTYKTAASKTEKKPTSKSAAKSTTKAVAKPATKTSPKTAAKAAAKSVTKPAAKPATKTAAKPATKTAVSKPAKTVAKPASKTAAKPAVKVPSKSATKPVAKKTPTNTATKPASKPVAKPAAKKAAKPVGKAPSKTTAKPAAKSNGKSATAKPVAKKASGSGKSTTKTVATAKPAKKK